MTVQSWLDQAKHYASIVDWRNENLCRELANSLAELEAMDIANARKKTNEYKQPIKMEELKNNPASRRIANEKNMYEELGNVLNQLLLNKIFGDASLTMDDMIAVEDAVTALKSQKTNLMAHTLETAINLKVGDYAPALGKVVDIKTLPSGRLALTFKRTLIKTFDPEETIPIGVRGFS